jgi:[acyl-carrier-protein] S-malonyltransferase
MTGQIAFVFPGQGSQTVGMGQALAQTYKSAGEIFQRADEILKFKLSELCFAGPQEQLDDTYNTQPALFTTSVACLAALKEAGYDDLEPAFVAGHSLGEYSALVAAGIVSFETGLKLVRERGRLMKEAGMRSPGGMAAIIRLDAVQLAKICLEASAKAGKPVQIANENAPDQIAISGDVKALEAAMEMAQAAGAKRVVRLAVSIAAHSPLMESISDDFGKVIEGTAFSAPEHSLIGNVTGLPLEDAGQIKQELRQQLTHKVKWIDSINYMLSHGVTHFIELGSKDVLTGLIRRIDKNVPAIPVGDPESIQALREKLA